MEANLRDDLAPTRAGAASALALAVLAMTLAAVGIYGVTTYVVSQRTREVGVRLALGAEPSAIRRLIIGQAMRPVAIGALVGLPLAAGVSTTASKLLLGVHPLDPVAFLAVCAFLGAVAFVASYLPARRAMHVNPLIALRQA
jgi:ABC-type antimicrobial peptide transport system permease subunit